MYLQEQAEELAKAWIESRSEALKPLLEKPAVHVAALSVAVYHSLLKGFGKGMKRYGWGDDKQGAADRFMDDLATMYEEDDCCSYKDDEEYFASIYGE